jgi:lauroyl/myristoyl acyltransferase
MSRHLNKFASGIVSLIGSIPFSLRSQIGWWLGYSIAFFPFRDRLIAALQLRVFLKQFASGHHVRSTFANASRTLFESFDLSPVLSSGSYTITVEGQDLLNNLRDSSRPTVALTAHTGNWDLLGAYIIHQGIKVSTIGREARNPLAQCILSSIRQRYGIQTLWRSDRTAIKKLISELKDGNVIAGLIDQDTRVSSSFIPFFGAPAKTPTSLITLGLKHKALFVSAFLFRTAKRKFTLYLKPIEEKITEDGILLAYNTELEHLIRKHPDQWVWFHKRWRSLPDGTILSTPQYIKYLEASLERRRENKKTGGKETC